MAKVIASTDIAVPAEAIWSLLCDPYRYPEFADPVDRMVEVPDEAMGPGYVYKAHGGIPPFKAESEWTVTVFEPMHRQVHVGDDGTMTLHLDNLLEPTETGTRFIQILELRPRWYMALLNAILWPLFMRRRAQKGMDRTGENVKRIAEGGA
ncbi:MAG: SRPBCC family protein [Actinobacteria bacterium]|nr:SRPBCC family protein [Actinomycetota bacterium]